MFHLCVLSHSLSPDVLCIAETFGDLPTESTVFFCSQKSRCRSLSCSIDHRSPHAEHTPESTQTAFISPPTDTSTMSDTINTHRVAFCSNALSHQSLHYQTQRDVQHPFIHTLLCALILMHFRLLTSTDHQLINHACLFWEIVPRGDPHQRVCKPYYRHVDR